MTPSQDVDHGIQDTLVNLGWLNGPGLRRAGTFDEIEEAVDVRFVVI
jgi:hypothetical protein